MGFGGAQPVANAPALSLQDKEPRGIIPLENLSIREVEDSKKPVSAGEGVLGLWLALVLRLRQGKLEVLQTWEGPTASTASTHHSD